MFWRILRDLERARTTRRSHLIHRVGSRRIEHLEKRQLLTAANLFGGILTVPGTTGNDTILIASTSNGTNVQVTINNKVDSTFALSTINQIQINADAGNDLITVKSIDKPVNVDGGAGVNQLTIIGQAGSNTFVLNDTSVDVNDSVGNMNTYSTTNIQRLSINGQNANDTFTIETLPSITTVIDGSGGLNTLQGPSADTKWDITVSNGGTIKNSLLRFGNIQSLVGSTGKDSFVFSAGRSISSTIDGGSDGDTNSISYANFTTPVTINLQTDSAIGLGRFLNIDNITGGAGKDTIVGPNSNNTWSIGVGGIVTFAGINFTGFENLTGGTQNDTFQFADGAFDPRKNRRRAWQQQA